MQAPLRSPVTPWAAAIPPCLCAAGLGVGNISPLSLSPAPCFNIPPGFPSFYPCLYKRYTHRTPLSIPTWMCHLFPAGPLTSWSTRKCVEHMNTLRVQVIREAAEIKLRHHQSLGRSRSWPAGWGDAMKSGVTREARLREQLQQSFCIRLTICDCQY